MSEELPLKALHRATTHKEPIIFFKQTTGDDSDANNTEQTDSIKDATHVQFGNDTNKTLFELDSMTKFYNEDKPQSLRSVVFCWLHDKSSIVDYKNECSQLGISDFKFLVKTELTTWLNGNSDSCAFNKEEDTLKKSNDSKSAVSDNNEAVGAGTGATGDNDNAKRKLEDPQLERIKQFERDSIDHNAALRGSKNIDFSYLLSDAKKFIHQLKRAKVSNQQSYSKPSSSSSSSASKKQPIIIVSPATTALLSLSNIKEFLEEGRFKEPLPSNRPPEGLVIVKHPSDKLISAGQQIMVVDNVDMFSKPDYWDRVIAIFTTGQAWQFSKYKYSQPDRLFQKYAGFYFGYLGEAAPQQIKNWNVTEIKVDRGDKRFRDKMIVRDFWSEIDKILINKGYGKQY